MKHVWVVFIAYGDEEDRLNGIFFDKTGALAHIQGLTTNKLFKDYKWKHHVVNDTCEIYYDIDSQVRLMAERWQISTGK